MLLKRNIKRWVAADLLTEAVGTEIYDFEKERKSGRFMRGLMAVGALTIVLGILAIIGANWYGIPGGVKILGHVLVNAALMYGVYHFDRNDRLYPKEFSLVGLGALTLTLIALVGQVLQLDGSVTNALILWMVLVTPLMVMFGKTYISLVPWVVGLVSTIFDVIVEDGLFWGHRYEEVGLVFVGLGCSLVLIAASIASRYMDRRRGDVEDSALSRVLVESGAVMAIIIATGVTLIGGREFFYRLHELSGPANYVIVGLLALSVVPWVMPTSKSLRIVYSSSTIAILLSMLIGTDWDDFSSALVFTGYWMAIGYVAFREDRNALMNTALTFIALRMYGIYIEAYGDLASTGFGLIFSGALLMGLGYGVHRAIKIFSEYQLVKKEG